MAGEELIVPSSTDVSSIDSHPSFGLKLQAFLCSTAFLVIIIAIYLGGIICIWNLVSSSSNSNGGLYIVILYASMRLLTPGGAPNAHKRPNGGVWRKFSERYFFFVSSIHRRYLNLSFSKPLPPELVEAESQPDAQFILAAFPHGCNSDFRLLMDGILSEVFPNMVRNDKIRALAASVLFWIPVAREISLWTGCIDASRPVAEATLKEGKSLIILPGGEAEQIRTQKGREIVYLKNRKGFVKLALRHGIPLVPVYVFGCSDSYHTYNGALPGFRMWLVKNLGVCITLCTGLWGNPICPLPKTTTIVMGKPIRFGERSENPTTEELDKAHAIFVRELSVLFETHKTALGYGNRTLEII
mmetsp:Transcript_5754/g.16427  ORF Transcript_5754/g.16427 Transcript_5754/m.16427 type:complete len:357 (+) Transcript_5754:180-1250(+)|eukprot:CAMPEP_0172364784 /NCGR_PEP_ID=MMETSP1060-20121228/7834_1 /TAXON_ID=37318 /ORGANISM="Pseudo-nitzschia pungens, Strain cf. cingulata" /LENGTH=356 /DNA_ID=CAMNT_0013087873 /DNA_START=83 /DNA_END=1153 /DNA_ORIENTATION=+